MADTPVLFAHSMEGVERVWANEYKEDACRGLAITLIASEIGFRETPQENLLQKISNDSDLALVVSAMQIAHQP